MFRNQVVVSIVIVSILASSHYSIIFDLYSMLCVIGED
uniref:Uncharacterized protein n=1 Tax=Aegilops tauschii subsp. strangulata TaxID=200361 RepID=A0A453RGP4_AEGTS